MSQMIYIADDEKNIRNLIAAFLRKEGYTFVQEDMILEGGKFYPMMKVRKKQAGQTEGEDVSEEQQQLADRQQDNFSDDITQELADTFGPCLLAQRNPVLYEYIFRQKEDIQRLIHAMKGMEESERCRKRREELKAELYLLTQAESLYK